MTRPFIRTPQRVLICGDRNWTDSDLIRNVILKHWNPHIDCVIHGDARGADRLGAAGAYDLGVTKIIPFPADWDKYHKAAGHIRNQQMLTEGKPTLVLAFHNNITASKGTKDMVKRSLKAGLPVYLNGNQIFSLS